MIPRWQWLLLQLSRRLWLRVTLFAIVAIVTALLGIAAPDFLPSFVPTRIGPDAIDRILGILASSMLAVTTFSLATMVSAYSAATSNATPRATKLLMDDPTSQNALGTFIGSFLFSLVGIIALSTGAYGEAGRLLLFAVTLAVVALIVLTILRWIDHLSKLGRVGETIDRVEAATSQALRERARTPYLGGRALPDPDRWVPDEAEAVFTGSFGYVQHVDVEAIQERAEAAGGDVYVLALPGAFVHPCRPLARVLGIADSEVRRGIVGAFSVGDARSFDQDPRFGVCVLAEIASRALSPAVNDPGTAIDVIGTGVKVLAMWAQPDATPRADARLRCPRVHVPPIRVDELFDDFFTPIARDGAAIVEVQIRLQKALGSLSALDPAQFGAAARRHSAMALTRAESAMTLDADKAMAREAAKAWHGA
jgi:uncharacterized membrane protein